MIAVPKPLPANLKNLPRAVEYFEECPNGHSFGVFGNSPAFPLRTSLAQAIERGEAETSRCPTCGEQNRLCRAQEA